MDVSSSNTLPSPPTTSIPQDRQQQLTGQNVSSQQQVKKRDPSIPSLLNSREEEYLPTPVTPATAVAAANSILPLLDAKSQNNPPTCAKKQEPSSDQAEKPNTTTVDKPYVCHECEQTFSRPHNLKSHLATHSSERPYQCEICNHHFRRQHDLKRHKKLHTGERPYVCNNCFRSFARQDALSRHQRAEGGMACTVHNTKKVKADVVLSKSATSPDNNKESTPRRAIPQLHIPFPASQPLPGQHDEPRILSFPPPNNINDQLARPTLPPVSIPPPTNLEQENKELREQLAQWREVSDRQRKHITSLEARVHDLQVENNVLRSLIVDAQRQSKRDRQDTSSPTAPDKRQCLSSSPPAALP